MLTVIEDKEWLQELQEKFLEKLKSQTDEVRYPVLGHQGGSWKDEAHYSIKNDIWFCGFEAENRYWNGFGRGEPIDGLNANITCEINFPFEGINRRIAGAFAQDDFGNIFILHRGKIGGGRRGIGKSLFQEQYRGKFEDAVDGDRITEFALIGDIESDNLIQQIASFVREVHRIKEDEIDFDTSTFSFSEEFFGRKTISGRESTIANCNHGIIVNRLAEILEESGFLVGKDRNRDLFTYRGKQIQNIFEIKPDCSNSSLYSAIGQLVIYGINTSANLFMVLPTGLEEPIKEKLKSINIELIEFEWIDGMPEFYEIEKIKK
ncbi:MAG: hypothetical protein R2830_05260 [Saprospiraceae bacterium]